ncbi:hypothetical protein [Robbsia betulipollinis]|uniref:hypothetical protein n=1 Tax=Robbsia betulipollinis TaxID=2981849 RepID=UPI002271FDB1|nr:hypothetical protein [Robbsia betulipollinis]
MNVPHTTLASNVATAGRPAGGALRRFFREVWTSYAAHAEMRVMMTVDSTRRRKTGF